MDKDCNYPNCTACKNRRTDEALRKLLSYCKTQDGRYLTVRGAYQDVAVRLAKILDGES